MEEGALTTQPPTVEEQMKGSEGGAFQERGFNYWSKRSPAEGRTCTLWLEETFSAPPPERAWLQTPCVLGCPGMGYGSFLGSGADVRPLPCAAAASAGTCRALRPPCQEGVCPGDSL